MHLGKKCEALKLYNVKPTNCHLPVNVMANYKLT